MILCLHLASRRTFACAHTVRTNPLVTQIQLCLTEVILCLHLMSRCTPSCGLLSCLCSLAQAVRTHPLVTQFQLFATEAECCLRFMARCTPSQSIMPCTLLTCIAHPSYNAYFLELYMREFSLLFFSPHRLQSISVAKSLSSHVVHRRPQPCSDAPFVTSCSF